MKSFLLTRRCENKCLHTLVKNSEKMIIFQSKPESTPAVLLTHIHRGEVLIIDKSLCSVWLKWKPACSSVWVVHDWDQMEKCTSPYLSFISAEWSKSCCTQSVFPLCSFLSAAQLHNKTNQGHPEQLQLLTERNWRKAIKRVVKDIAVLRVTVYDPIRWRKYSSFVLVHLLMCWEGHFSHLGKFN